MSKFKVKDDLLKSAIQDAKAVQQVVLEKAKAELAESFAPHLKKMLAESLDNLTNEETEKASDEMEMSDEMKEAKAKDESEKVSDETIDVPEIENPKPDETEIEIKDTTDEKLVGDKDEITNEPIADINDATKNDEVELTGDDEIEIEVVDDENITDIDINDEAKIEGNATDETNIEPPVNTDAPVEIKDETDEAAKKVGDVMSFAGQDYPIMDTRKDIDGKNSYFIEFNGGMWVTPNKAKKVEEPVTEGKIKQISDQKEIKPGKEAKDYDKDNKEVKPGKEVSGFDKEMKTIKEENSKLTKQLLEHRRVVKYLQEKLNDFSTITAKLSHINELFKKYSLTESQKKQIVESFDLAENLKEAKIVYNTLNESFSNKVRKVTESTSESVKKTKKLNESFASGGIGSTKTDKVAKLDGGEQIISAEQGMRFAKLAGLKK